MFAHEKCKGGPLFLNKEEPLNPKIGKFQKRKKKWSITHYRKVLPIRQDPLFKKVFI